MKRMISWALILVLVLSLFAGCSNNSAEPTNAPGAPTDAVVVADENLANAIAYLKAFYKEVKDGDLTPADYERLGTVRVGGTAYEVVYTVDCDESTVKVVKGSGSMVTIDVNEESDKEVPYALTATITGTDGKTASLTWKHVVPVSLAGRGGEIVDAAYELKDGEALPYEATLTGEIIAIDTPYSADYKNITVTIKVKDREDKPIMCYRLKGEGADTLAMGDIITVTGTLKNYKGTIEFDAGCVLDEVIKGEGSSVEVPTDPQEILKAAFALDYGEKLPYPATLTGKITGIGSKYSAQYNNITVVIRTGEPWYAVTCFRMKGEGVDKIWLDDEITVTGILTNYNGTIEFDAGCQLVSYVNNPDPKAPSDPKEIIDAAYELGHLSTLPYPCTLTGKVISVDDAWSHEYQNITFTISVPGRENKPIQCYRVNGEGSWDIEIGDTVSVYGWLKNYDGTIEFIQGSTVTNIVKGAEELTGLAKDIKEASKLASGKKLSYKTTITDGTIIDNPYQSSYEDSKDSYKFTVSDGSTAVLCYYVPVVGGTPKKGDTVTVEGYLKNHEGTVEFDSSATAILGGGAVPEKPTIAEPTDGSKLTVAEAVELGNQFGKDEYTTGKFYLTGEITDISNTEYGNMKLTDGTGTIDIYGTFDKDGSTKYGDMAIKPQAGDTITVYGVIGKYYSAQMKNGVITNHVSSAPATYTVTCNTAENGTVSVNPTEFEAGATVTLAVHPAESYELDTLTVTDTNGADVTVTGTTFTMPEANVTVTATFKAAVVTYTVTCETAENGTVTADKASATKGETITLTAAPNEGFELDTLTAVDANGTPVTVTGTSFTMPEANVTVTATFKKVLTVYEKIFALKAGEKLQGVSVEGTVSEVSYTWSSKSKSITCSITVPGGTIKCSYLSGNGVSLIKQGDYIKVSGTAENYNGAFSIYSPCTLTYASSAGYSDPGDLTTAIENATKLGNNDYLPYSSTIENATITQIDTEYSSNYDNITVTVAFGGSSIQCYRLSGGSDLQVGDVITVTGRLTAYNGVAQMGAGATYTK